MSVTITRIKIAGDQTGNVAEVDSSNQIKAVNPSEGPVTPGTVATKSTLAGGQYNSTPPTLTNTQQASLQLTSDGKLKVDATNTNSGFSNTWSSKLRYDDMNVSTNGVARGTSIATSASWATIYSYSGSGFIGGLIVNLETFAGWEIRLLVDTEIIFSFVSEDLTTDTLYDVDDTSNSNFALIGVMKGAHDTFSWHPPLSAPQKYNSQVQVQIRRPTAAAKKFQAGVMILSRET